MKAVLLGRQSGMNQKKKKRKKGPIEAKWREGH